MNAAERWALVLVTTALAAMAGMWAANCSLYTRPEPYIPPPLTLQGTKPDPEDAGP